MLLMMLALASDPVAFDGTRLHERRACYALSIERDGAARSIGAEINVVSRARENGRDVWRVVTRQKLSRGEMQDTYVLDAGTLQPLTYENRMAGETRIQVTYAADRITGTLTDQSGTKQPVDVALSGQVWDGHLYGAVLGALPLAEGARFSIPVWNHDRGLAQLVVEVTGSRSVPTPSGPRDAWVVSVEPAPGVRAEYLVGKADGVDLGYSARPMRQTPVDCATLDAAA